MYDEGEPRNRLPMIAIIAAMVFGAGSVWAGTQGRQLAFGQPNTKTEATIAQISPANNSASIFNSSKDLGDTIKKTTAYIDQAISSIPIKSPVTTIQIGGDIMLDRRIRSMGQKKGYDYLFASLAPLFKTADVVVTNLEGPVTTNPSKTVLPSGATTAALDFTFAPGSTNALSAAGITAVSLANNHEDNFGVEGVVETKQWLKKSNLEWFGSPWNASSTELVIEKNGMKIAFVGYHAFQTGIARVIADIKRLSTDGDFVIVMPHWGPEYETHSTAKMRSDARSFVAAGAKAIIGSHPHVIMENETIAGVPVYYSVGNLLFDQYFSEDVLNGEIVELKLVNGPAGPSIDSVSVYKTRLDREKGVVLN